MHGSNSENRAAQYLLITYSLFIVYGCLIPFHFNLDPNFVWSPVPSTTDAIIFSASAWAGIALFDAYHKSSARPAHQRHIDVDGAL